MPTILVVDDSAVDRRLVTGLLEVRPQWQIGSAQSGEEALVRMRERLPDLIVSDVQMPEMNGLELVKAVHDHHPRVPIILMTAYGSEVLALEALMQGAVSYVPKSQLAEKLELVVAEILAWARAARDSQELLEHLGGATFHLPNDPDIIDPLVEFVQKMSENAGFGDYSGQLQVQVALKEALLNALYRGNLEIGFEEMQEVRARLLTEQSPNPMEERRRQPPYRDRRIFVDVRVSPDELSCVVRDEGPGFDVTAVREPGVTGALDLESGRGLTLIRSFMDEVVYNDVGNEMTMVKRAPGSPSESCDTP
jgi:CheY-like chemotaxis protein